MIQKFENFNKSSQPFDDNLAYILIYIKQFKIILSDMEKGGFSKTKINKLLSIIDNIDIESLPSEIKQIIEKYNKNFYYLSKLSKIVIKKRDYIQGINDLKYLKNWIIKEIENI